MTPLYTIKTRKPLRTSCSDTKQFFWTIVAKYEFGSRTDGVLEAPGRIFQSA